MDDHLLNSLKEDAQKAFAARIEREMERARSEKEILPPDDFFRNSASWIENFVSSNVYSFAFCHGEKGLVYVSTSPRAGMKRKAEEIVRGTVGILGIRFSRWIWHGRGRGKTHTKPQEYRYHDVPVAKYLDMLLVASKGEFVWDSMIWGSCYSKCEKIAS